MSKGERQVLGLPFGSLDRRGARRRAFLFCGVAVTASVAAISALAASDNSGTSAATAVQEVIVTAGKRSTNLQETPIAVSAISGAAIATRGISGAQDLSALVPNMNFGDILGNPTVSIRGVGLPIVSGDSQQGVASYMDGVYLTTPSIADVAIGDLDRIEVVRGPQGTLYGRNATGGAVTYITNGPSDTFGAGATIGYGNYDTFTAKGYLTGPIIGDKLTARLFAMHVTNKGYGKNDFTGGPIEQLNTNAVRLSVRARPDPAWTIDLAGFYAYDYGAYTDGEIQSGIVGIPVLPGAPAPGSYHIGPDHLLSVFGTRSTRSTAGGIATIQWKGDHLAVKSVTGYLGQVRIFDQSGLEIIPSATYPFDYFNGRHETDRTFSEELNLSFTFPRFEGILGGYFADERNRNFIANNVFFAPTLTTGAPASYVTIATFPLHRTEATTNGALFADGTYHISDSVRLYGGLRGSYDEVSGHEMVPNDPRCENGVDFAQDNLALSPRAGVQVDVSTGQMVYAQYERGYKSGGYSAVACLNKYKPEYLSSFEVGYKSQMFDRRLTIDAAAFYYDYHNYQLFEITPQLASFILNVPSVTSYGAEVEIQGRPVGGLALDGSLGWLHARYGDFYGADGFTYGASAPTENLKGRQIVQAPDWTATAGAEYKWTLNSSLFASATLRGELTYSDSYSLRRFNRPFDIQPAYVAGNAYLILSSPGDRYTLRFFCRNLGDTRWRLGEVDNPNTGLLQGPYNPPRTFGAEISAKWR